MGFLQRIISAAVDSRTWLDLLSGIPGALSHPQATAIVLISLRSVAVPKLSAKAV